MNSRRQLIRNVETNAVLSGFGPLLVIKGCRSKLRSSIHVPIAADLSGSV